MNVRVQSAYRNPVGDAFGLHVAPTLMTRTLHKSTMTVTELKSGAPNLGLTKPIPHDDAYLVALQVRECPDHDLYFDGRLVRPRNFVAGVTTIYDLRRGPVADLRSPFHSLHFYLPRKALDGIAEEAGAPLIGDLRHQPGTGIDDPVIRHLLSSLIPFMANPEEASALFVDHVALALGTHVAQTYGEIRRRQQPARGGLSPRQKRRAKELLTADLSGEIPLDRLAAECGLSARHFARAFKQSVGVPPHRWLLQLRIERAKELLHNPHRPLADIALACGFVDQSHFTHAFAAATGVTPGAWRRMQI